MEGTGSSFADAGFVPEDKVVVSTDGLASSEGAFAEPAAAMEGLGGADAELTELSEVALLLVAPSDLLGSERVGAASEAAFKAPLDANDLDDSGTDGVAPDVALPPAAAASGWEDSGTTGEALVLATFSAGLIATMAASFSAKVGAASSDED